MPSFLRIPLKLETTQEKVQTDRRADEQTGRQADVGYPVDAASEYIYFMVS